MDSTKELGKSFKKNIKENIKNERPTVNNQPEETKMPWQLIFILGAFAIGAVLLILKIVGIL